LRIVLLKSSVLLCVSLWAKGLSANDIHKEMFLVYDGKCLSHKAVCSWIEKHGKHFADDEEVEMEVRKWLRQQSKDYMLLILTHW
jgi:hypothetical protein